jgi:hypothetical protein
MSSARTALAAALASAALSALAQGRPPPLTAGEPRSAAVFPEQEIALRFSHAQHLAKGVKCQQCHNQVSESDLAADRNIPTQRRCEACHEVEAARGGQVVDPPSACADCHPGFDWTVHAAPRPSRFPPPALHFSHKRHLLRGAACADCHGDLARVELATRAQLPRMASCLVCHDGVKASMACATCHLGSARGAKGAPLDTALPGGLLRPGPGNPFGLDHGPRFERAHAQLAARQRDQCLACHTESSCLKCHDGATRPQSVHPGDFLSTHMVPARQDQPRCDACHRRQSFCVACHERTGVGANAPAFQDPGARVHPAGWMVPGPGHHGLQAARGIGACASCHREEQCLQCHATGGVKPHPPGFASGCAQMLKKNDRACVKCHDPATLAALCR